MALAIPLRRRIIPRTLFGRSLLIVILPLLVLQATIASVFYSRHWDTVTRWLAIGLGGQVAMIVELVDAAPDAATREAVLRSVRMRTDLLVAVVPGRPSFAPEPVDSVGLDAQVSAVLSQRILRPFRIEPVDGHDDVLAIEVPLREGTLRVVAAKKRVTSSTATLLLIWMLSIAAVLIVVALFFLRRQLRPIRRLAEAAEGFGKGRDIGDFKLEGAIEIRQAGQAFNQMRQRLLRFMTQRTEMLAAVSHDLRTPLTRMKLELAMLERKDDPALAELATDVAEMERLVESYLGFARGEGREVAVVTELRPVLQEMRERAARTGTEVDLVLGPDLALPLRAVAIRRCLGNLVDNACRYGRRVRIAARAVADRVEIDIEDDGPGIPEDRREDVFQPFFRLDSSRNPTTGGVGLGLTIARDVALGHGGEIELGRSALGGLKATVRLPR